MAIVQKLNDSKVIPDWNFSELEIFHTRKVESVIILILTMVFKIIKDTSNSRGLPNRLAINWYRLSALARNRSR
jgi:hypothetical protein